MFELTHSEGPRLERLVFVDQTLQVLPLLFLLQALLFQLLKRQMLLFLDQFRQ